jgi:hypothetical protein
MATSARPDRIMCIASPIACAEDAHALATTKAGPWTPNSIAIWLAGAEIIEVGIDCGWTLAMPRANSRWKPASTVAVPPLPQPSTIAVRSASTGSPNSAASSTASNAATIASVDSRSS